MYFTVIGQYSQPFCGRSSSSVHAYLGCVVGLVRPRVVHCGVFMVCLCNYLGTLIFLVLVLLYALCATVMCGCRPMFPVLMLGCDAYFHALYTLGILSQSLV